MIVLSCVVDVRQALSTFLPAIRTTRTLGHHHSPCHSAPFHTSITYSAASSTARLVRRAMIGTWDFVRNLIGVDVVSVEDRSALETSTKRYQLETERSLALDLCVLARSCPYWCKARDACARATATATARSPYHFITPCRHQTQLRTPPHHASILPPPIAAID